jgi:hypothetical protein
MPVLATCRYEVARNFRPPGRLMFLRPVKPGARSKVAQRTYDPVWITSEVRPNLARRLLPCPLGCAGSVSFAHRAGHLQPRLDHLRGAA